MKYLIVIITLLLTVSLGGQSADCTQDRYLTNQYSNITKTTVQYGKNININTTDSLDLFMDIYTPDGDNAPIRSAIILAHGGSFLGGNRSDLEGLCRQYAGQGYVTASISYHLWPLSSGFPDSLDLIDVVVKAVGDMKGAIRYFKNDQANDNLWRVDSTRIIIGGYSAGAVTAMHASHMDTTDIALPAFMKDNIDINGGIEGQANQLNNTSTVLATVNLSGALYDRRFIDLEDPPFISYHGNMDGTVNFRRALANGIITLEGSALLHQKADEIGILNHLDSVDGGGHTDIYLSSTYADNLSDFYNNANIFLGSKVCPQLITSRDEVSFASEAYVFPNPADNFINIYFDKELSGVDISIYNLNGQLVLHDTQALVNQVTLEVSGISNGIYLMKLVDQNGGLEVRKVVVN